MQACSLAQSCPTLCKPTDFVVRQAPLPMEFSRQEEWVAIPFSRGFSWPRDQTQVACIAGGFFTIWASGKTWASLKTLPWRLCKSHCIIRCPHSPTLHTPHSLRSSSREQPKPLFPQHTPFTVFLQALWRIDVKFREKNGVVLGKSKPLISLSLELLSWKGETLWMIII